MVGSIVNVLQRSVCSHKEPMVICLESCRYAATLRISGGTARSRRRFAHKVAFAIMEYPEALREQYREQENGVGVDVFVFDEAISLYQLGLVTNIVIKNRMTMPCVGRLAYVVQ